MMSLFNTKKVRYAVVGAGHIAQFAFMPAVKHTGNSELTAIITSDVEKAKKLGKKYNLKQNYFYDNYNEFLKSGVADAVYIALPNQMHKSFTIPALEAGLHVLLEKPMAVSEEECNEIMAVAGRSTAKLMVAYRLHFEPANLKVLKLVRDGEIGRPRIFSSVFSQKISPQNHRAKMGFWAGVVADMGPYPINAARTLFQAEPLEVRAVGSHRSILPHDTPDTVSVILTFPDAQIAQFTVSYAEASADSYRILGNKGEILLTPGFGYGEDYICTINIGGKIKQKKIGTTDHFGGELQYFSNCILQNQRPEPDAEEGWCDVRIIAAIERALNTGEVQKLAHYQRKHYPSFNQAIKLSPIKMPSDKELVNVRSPMGGMIKGH